MYLDEQTEGQMRARLTELRREHRALDDTLQTLSENAYADQLQVKRMKKHKLVLKDAIARLESRLIPDLDA